PAWFQSTRPRGARPWQARAESCDRAVSIHAPAWGATADGGVVLCASSSFNPRARVGRDRRGRGRGGRGQGFNPRARVGRDLIERVDKAPVGDVSIHAPAWGATTRP